MAVQALPEIERRTEIGFRRGAHVPAGVSAEALAAELDAIAEKHGVASTEVIRQEIEEDPNAYPMIRAWLPKDADEAWDIAVREAIGACVRSVVRYEVRVVPGSANLRSAEVRLFHVVSGPEEQRGYLRLDVIARDEERVLELYDSLQQERESFQAKERNVGAEIRSLLELQKRSR